MELSMKVIIDQPQVESIEIIETLEPNSADYCIKQGDNIVRVTEYQLHELYRTCKLFLNG